MRDSLFNHAVQTERIGAERHREILCAGRLDDLLVRVKIGSGGCCLLLSLLR